MSKAKIIMLRGLPASGKSTWAKQYIADNPQACRVNKDDLRAMLHGGKFSKSNERQTIRVRNAAVIAGLDMGRVVIVDDTNFNPIHEQELSKMASQLGAGFEVMDFDVDLATAIERDLKRPASVGSEVIKRMYKQYVQKKPEAIEENPALPSAIICDIDGTLAHMAGRSPYEWHKVGTDTLDKTIANILHQYEYRTIILLSGRDSVCRGETQEWLKRHNVHYDHLLMRGEGDMRKDNIVKRELFEQHIRGKYNVMFVLDDRDQVVDMWRNDVGLKVLQVAEGAF